MGRRHRSTSKSRSKSGAKSRSLSRKKSISRSRERSLDPHQGTRLHIADVDPDLTTREVEKAFERYGPLVEVWIARSTPCFGFVVFENRKDAADAVDALNGHTLGAKRLRVSYALPRVQDRRIRSFGGRAPQNDFRCYQCGLRGHFSRDCNRKRFIKSPVRRRWTRSPIRTERYRSRSMSRSRSRGRRSGNKKSKNMIDSDDGNDDDCNRNSEDSTGGGRGNRRKRNDDEDGDANVNHKQAAENKSTDDNNYNSTVITDIN